MSRHFPLSPLARAGLLSAAAISAPAAAAEAPQLPAIQVSAERPADDGRLQPLGATPAPATIDHAVTQPVTVIERQDIERLNTDSTLDLLGRVPNATVSRSGGIAGTIFLRGLNTNDMRVPMFIDGDRFRGRNTLQFMLISPTEIEQVEVVRGPDVYKRQAPGTAPSRPARRALRAR